MIELNTIGLPNWASFIYILISEVEKHHTPTNWLQHYNEKDNNSFFVRGGEENETFQQKSLTFLLQVILYGLGLDRTLHSK